MNCSAIQLALLCALTMTGFVSADEPLMTASAQGCAAVGDFFLTQVWPKVGARTCLKCHVAGGDAEESDFVLLDPARETSAGRAGSLAHNRQAFAKIASRREGDDWLVLGKVTGEVDHEGGQVLKRDSTGFRILRHFVLSVNGASAATTAADLTQVDREPFFDGIVMLDDRKLLRRLTLSLAARLPSESEIATVKTDSLDGLDGILDQVLTEDAFYDRLAEGFNDIFLTRGYDGVPERALSYEHFSTTRGWVQKHDLSHVGDENAQRKARYKLTDDYREAMLCEPMELVKHIVRNNRPFTEIINADYIMVSPYTSRGYGVFEDIRDRFENPDNPFEFVSLKLKALQHRDGRNHQESATGFYPHAGLLSTFQYLKRYPTTETNRNRLRVRMYFQHFLGIDVMQLAPRVNDAAAITAKYEIPTMQASDCVVCHRVIDPIAGLFQDYYAVDGNGVYGRRKDGWFKDMFQAGFETTKLPADERWRSLQWLAEHTIRDPRFAVAMVGHVYYILTGRKPLRPPEDINDPLYDARQRAYCVQRDEIEAIAREFASSGFNLKSVFKAWAKSPFYRADGFASAIDDPERLAELDDIGVVRLLAPEQLERKLKAVLGRGWGRLDSQFEILYGGIDSKAVTERNSDPGGAMGAIQRMMANDMACRCVGVDFTTEPGKRILFPGIEREVLPGVSEESDQQIRQAIVHLHERILGRYDSIHEPEVERTFDLFSSIIADAHEKERFEKLESYFCRGADDARLDDEEYTIRAWRAVVTYLLRQQEFLYE